MWAIRPPSPWNSCWISNRPTEPMTIEGVPADGFARRSRSLGSLGAFPFRFDGRPPLASLGTLDEQRRVVRLASFRHATSVGFARRVPYWLRSARRNLGSFRRGDWLCSGATGCASAPARRNGEHSQIQRHTAIGFARRIMNWVRSIERRDGGFARRNPGAWAGTRVWAIGFELRKNYP